MLQGSALTLSAFFLMAALPAHAVVPCPPMPTAVTGVNRDVKTDIKASVGSLGTIKAGEVAAKAEVEAKNLFDKYPNVDRLLTLQTMSATYCAMLNGTAGLTDVEKLDRWERFQERVLGLQAAAPVAPAKQPAPKATTEPKVAKPAQRKFSIAGSWAGAPACQVLFSTDDGENVEGSCDGGGYRHKVSGTYVDAANIRIIITRTDPTGCVTNARGFIKIINRDSVEMGQEGWHGCNVTSGSVTTLLSRQ